ncbi:MAG: choice-of-anchor L domain-containing protein, partial [Myxococcota bacterium]
YKDGTGTTIANQPPEAGTDFAPVGTDGDASTLTINLNVPNGIDRLTFDFYFLSAESPDWVGSSYNDTFTAQVTDAVGTRQIALASVNSSVFFDASETRAGDTGYVLNVDDPSGVDSVFGAANYPPNVTLFPDAGITDFQRVSTEIAPGPVTLQFDIRDLGDGILDSAVVLDNVTLSAVESLDPNPDLIDQFIGQVLTDPVQLATEGKPVTSVAADGVTQLLLRTNVPGPGVVEFSQPAGTTLSDGSGLNAVGTTGPSDLITVSVVEALPGKFYGFALYTSPSDFNRGGDENLDKRTVDISVQYIPASGMGFQHEHELTIVRPPVVMVHDMWQSCKDIKDNAAIYQDPAIRSLFINITCADYSNNNATSDISNPISPQRKDPSDFASNTLVIPQAINDALAVMRGRGIAATQVELVGHGMGGLLARKYYESISYNRFTNFYAGDFNRLITINTPHLGARMAEEIVAFREHLKAEALWPAISIFLLDLGLDIDNEFFDAGNNLIPNAGSALDDLTAAGPVISALKQTAVPSHVMATAGGTNLLRGIPAHWGMLLTRIRGLYAHMEANHPSNAGLASCDMERFSLIFDHMSSMPVDNCMPTPPLPPPAPPPPPPMLLSSKIFCSEDHDLFATVDEQLGGLAVGDTTTVFNPINVFSEHFKAVNHTGHNDALRDLLNSPVAGATSSFAAALPEPGLNPAPNSCTPLA